MNEKQKIQLLEWLLSNVNNIKIKGIGANPYDGTPSIAIELKDWDMADESKVKKKEGYYI